MVKAEVPDSVVARNGILIDYKRDGLLPEQGKAMLTREGFYKRKGEKSPQETLTRAATCYCFGDHEFAQRIYDYASNGWFTNASPVLSNAMDVDWPSFSIEEFEEAGDWLSENVDPDGLSISCYLNYIPDTKEGLVSTRAETAWLSMMGGGIGIYAGNRGPDEKSTGVMKHLSGYDSDTLAYKQTSSRRGSMAAYLDVTHPEIVQFIEMRVPVGGEQSNKCFNLNNAVIVDDSFMEKVIKNEDYELIDPKHGPTGIMKSAKEIWDRIMEVRFETGEPYIMFKDTVNRNIPKWITNPMYHVSQSNLCSEITLMTDEQRTAVCCLSSLNLEKYEEWKDTRIVEDLIRYLDNVLEYFIRLAPPFLDKAVYSATMERSLGLGTLGWHSFLQKLKVPFESDQAMALTNTIYKQIRERAIDESKQLATERGEAPDCAGSGMRNCALIAIAPNASSSSIVNASPSIEPWNSNAFTAQGRTGSFLIRNKYLEETLESYGMNNQEVWKSIISNEGSIQHLDFLSDLDKMVFKTSFEIDPMWIVNQAAARQKYICQSQSLNLFIGKEISAQEMGNIHIQGWLKGIKTFYYCRAKPTTRAKTGDGTAAPLNSIPVKVQATLSDPDECVACQA